METNEAQTAADEIARLRAALDRLAYSVSRVRSEMTPEMLEKMPVLARAGLDLALVEAKHILGYLPG